MKEDHQQQLTELKRAHFERLGELKRQASQELSQLKAEFIKRTIELTSFYQQWLTTQVSQQTESLKQWGQFWDDFQGIVPESSPGGDDGRTGRGRGTAVPSMNTIDPNTVWRVSGNGGTHQTATTVTNNSIVAPITINAAPGQSVFEIGNIVERKLSGLFRSM